MPNVQKMKEFKHNDADWKKLSTTLSASAKIYGYRLESYGIDMYKMVGVFTRAQMSNNFTYHPDAFQR